MATLEMIPVAPGYCFERPADLADPKVREELSTAALKAFVQIVENWNLTEAQARALLGGIASSTFHAWRSNPAQQKLSQDTLVRISLLLGIYRALDIYFGQPLAHRWITLGNQGSIFAGQPPIDYLIRHGQPGMVQVRRMLDSWSSGS